MTLDELKQLPSRERDALVAERVMGWTVYREWDRAQWGELREEYSGPWFKLPNARPEQWPSSLTEFADSYWIVTLMERMRATRFVGVPADMVSLKCRGNEWECGWEGEEAEGIEPYWKWIMVRGERIELVASAPTAGEAVVLGALLGAEYAEQA